MTLDDIYSLFLRSNDKHLSSSRYILAHGWQSTVSTECGQLNCGVEGIESKNRYFPQLCRFTSVFSFRCLSDSVTMCLYGVVGVGVISCSNLKCRTVYCSYGFEI